MDTEGDDDAQAVDIYETGFDGPGITYVDTACSYNSKKEPDDTAISADWSTDGSPGSGSGSSFTTQWHSPGTHSVTAKISGDQRTQDVDVMPPEIAIKELTFTSDHAVLRKNNSNWDATGDVYEKPEWKSDRNYPISHTMDQKVAVNLKISVIPASLPERSYVIKGIADDLSYDTTVTLSGGENNVVSITSNEKLDNKIATDDETVDWTIKMDGQQVGYTQTGPHRIYVLAGKPVLDSTSAGLNVNCYPTEKRIATVAGYCNQLTTQQQCADSIFASLFWAKVGGADLIGPNNRWTIYTGGQSQCLGLALWLQDHLKMIGFDPGEYKFCKPHANGTFEASDSLLPDTRLVSSTSGHPSGTGHGTFDSGKETLVCWDASGNANHFEAVAVVDSRYYAMGVASFDESSNTAKDVISAVFGLSNVAWAYPNDSSLSSWTTCNVSGCARHAAP